jgi:Fe2+ transport system protein FeoA
MESCPQTSLFDARPGDTLLVTEVTGSERTARRLAELGLGPGTGVAKVCGGRFGSMIVRVGATRLALSRKLAASVRVSPLVTPSVA